MPTQAEADAWAERETLGLIRNLPLKIDHLTRIVLASALATRVSWEVPFEVVPAADASRAPPAPGGLRCRGCCGMAAPRAAR